MPDPVTCLPGHIIPFLSCQHIETLFKNQVQYILTSLGLRHSCSFHCFASNRFGGGHVTKLRPMKCEKSVSSLPIWSVAVWEDDVGNSHLDHKGKAKTMTEKLTLKLPTSTILTVSDNKPLLFKLLVAIVVPTKHHDSITSRQRNDLVPDPSLTHKIKSRWIRDLRKC